ncbi:MAG: hypothetical protein RIR12_878 [Bacteroidota bacterium]|jgi:hypothetical protein
MFTYDLLEAGCHYLIKEKETDAIVLIKVAMVSDHCVFIQRYDDPMATAWKLKKDALHDIIECLSDAAVKQWEQHFFNSKDVFWGNDEED